MLRESVAMTYRMIQRCRPAFPIRMMCRCVQVSSSGNYGSVTRALSARTQENTRLLERIRALHADQNGFVGSPRIWEDLRYARYRCGRHRVAYLMQRAGLQGATRRRLSRKKPSRSRPHGIQNHLNRDSSAVAPNDKWVTDITYIRTAEQWLYLCVVLDLYSGLVVGWSMGPQQDRQLVVQALLMVVWQRPAHTPVILHSDRDRQFISEEYQRFLAVHQVISSMSAVGNFADNAAVRSFFGIRKRERVNRQHYRTKGEARADVYDYIERCRNPRQRRRLEIQQQAARLLTQPSTISG